MRTTHSMHIQSDQEFSTNYYQKNTTFTAASKRYTSLNMHCEDSRMHKRIVSHAPSHKEQGERNTQLAERDLALQ